MTESTADRHRREAADLRVHGAGDAAASESLRKSKDERRPLFPHAPKAPSVDMTKPGAVRDGLWRAAENLVGRRAPHVGEEPLRKSGVPSHMQALAIEHSRLLKAFREAEGRDPTLDDRGYWAAYTAILKRRVASLD